MNAQELRFRDNGLIPAVVQDEATGEVLMMAYMNREALQKTLETGLAHYWSRSRQSLWMKGETSGHIQRVKEIRADCDGDSILLRVEQLGSGACHKGYRSCFHQKVEAPEEASGTPVAVTVAEGEEPAFDPDEVYGAKGREILSELYRVIMERRDHPTEGSYTAYLFREGLDKILKKIGEESSEVLIAAKNEATRPLLNEVADLIYHLLVLLVERGVSLRQVFDVLRERRTDSQKGAAAE